MWRERIDGSATLDGPMGLTLLTVPEVDIDPYPGRRRGMVIETPAIQTAPWMLRSTVEQS